MNVHLEAICAGLCSWASEQTGNARRTYIWISLSTAADYFIAGFHSCADHEDETTNPILTRRREERAVQPRSCWQMVICAGLGTSEGLEPPAIPWILLTVNKRVSQPL